MGACCEYWNYIVTGLHFDKKHKYTPTITSISRSFLFECFFLLLMINIRRYDELRHPDKNNILQLP